MTVKKYNFFLASNIEKEEQWLTEMSSKGLHFKKYRFFRYYFEEDSNHSYVYQTDFRPEADEDYFQLYRDAGWEHVSNSYNLFHYFRTDASQTGVKKIYSDEESVKESYTRMMRFYLMLFILLFVSQLGWILNWRGYWIQYVVAVIVVPVIILYVFMLLSFRKKIQFYKKR